MLKKFFQKLFGSSEAAKPWDFPEGSSVSRRKII